MGPKTPPLGRRVHLGEAKFAKEKFGAGDGARTRGILLGKQVLYQLSYTRLGDRLKKKNRDFDLLSRDHLTDSRLVKGV